MKKAVPEIAESPPEPGRAEAQAARLFTNLLLSPLYRGFVDARVT
jgi:hypothetical protein